MVGILQQSLNPTPFVNGQVEDEVEGVDDFDDMGLCDELLRGIYGFGFEKPSMIQQKAIPLILTGIANIHLHALITSNSKLDTCSNCVLDMKR